MTASYAQFEAYINRELDKASSKAMSLGTKIHLYVEDSSNFMISEITAPTGVPKDIIETIFNNSGTEVPTTLEYVIDADILRIAKEFKYTGNNWSDETILKRVRGYDDYYKHLVQASNKILVTRQEHKDLSGMIGALESNENISNIIHSTNVQKEVVFVWTDEQGQTYKILVDELFITDESVKFWDLKSTRDPVEKFVVYQDFRMNQLNGETFLAFCPGPFYMYNYSRQMAFYTWIIRKITNKPVYGNLIPIQNTAPYSTTILPIDSTMERAGILEMNHALPIIKNYCQTYFEKYGNGNEEEIA